MKKVGETMQGVNPVLPCNELQAGIGEDIKCSFREFERNRPGKQTEGQRGGRTKSACKVASVASYAKNAGKVRSEGDVLELSTDGDRELLDRWLIDL